MSQPQFDQSSQPGQPDQHRFDRAIALEQLVPGRYRGHTTPEYWNMVGPYGGATSATLINAVLQHPDVLGEPISITVNFAGPIAEGEFVVTASPLRTNRSNQHWLLTLTQDDVTVTTATVITATRRETWADNEAPRPAAPSPDEVERFGGFPGINWIDSYDLRFVRGGLPAQEGAESPSSQTDLWIRDHPERPLDVCSLVAMTDSFYPRAFLRKGTYLPAGTVTLTVHLLADREEIAAHGTGHLLGTASSRRFERGYFDQSAELWTEDGVLLATSHQLVYFKV